MASRTDTTYHGAVNAYCFGCGACVSAAPLCFAATSDQRAVVVRQPDAMSLLDFHEAQQACPVGAIVLDGWPSDRRLRPRRDEPGNHA